MRFLSNRLHADSRRLGADVTPSNLSTEAARPQVRTTGGRNKTTRTDPDAGGAQRTRSAFAAPPRLRRAQQTWRTASQQIVQTTPVATTLPHRSVDGWASEASERWQLRLDDQLLTGVHLKHPKPLLRGYVAERCARKAAKGTYVGGQKSRDFVVEQHARPAINWLSSRAGRGLAACLAWPKLLFRPDDLPKVAIRSGTVTSAALAWPLHATLEVVDLAGTAAAAAGGATACALGLVVGYAGGAVVLALTPELACHAFLRAHSLETSVHKKAQAATRWLHQVLGRTDPPPTPMPKPLAVAWPHDGAALPSIPPVVASDDSMSAGPSSLDALLAVEALQAEYAQLLATALEDGAAAAPRAGVSATSSTLATPATPATSATPLLPATVSAPVAASAALPQDLAARAELAEAQLARDVARVPPAARLLLDHHLGESFAEDDGAIRSVVAEARRRRQSAAILLRRGEGQRRR